MQESFKHTNLSMLDVYKLALSEGISGKQAAWKYNVRYHSLWTAGKRHCLPPLPNSWSKKHEAVYVKMSHEMLMHYRESLEKELQTVKAIQERRANTAIAG